MKCCLLFILKTGPVGAFCFCCCSNCWVSRNHHTVLEGDVCLRFHSVNNCGFLRLMWRMMWRCGRCRSRELRRPCEASPP